MATPTPANILFVYRMTLAVITSIYTDDPFDVSAYAELRVAFWFYTEDLAIAEDFFLDYDDGTGWVTKKNWVRGTDFQNNDQWYLAKVDFSTNNRSGGRIRIRCHA